MLFRTISTICLVLVLLYPNIAFAFTNATGVSYILTSAIFLLPVAVCISLLPKKWTFCVFVCMSTILSAVELAMVDLYNEYLLPGGILSTINTNPSEVSEFINTNLSEIVHLIPVLLLGIISCCTYRKIRYSKTIWIVAIAMLIIPVGFVSFKLHISHKNELTVRYYVHNRILNRPPYNIFYQTWNAHIELKHRRQAANMKNINMGAHRFGPIPQKEVYVFGIGESLRYENVSMNGKYWRSTTPRLEAMENILLFDDYYSQACITMYSVPMLVTRATPDNFELNFAERSVIEPFRECGFKVYTIVNNTNLLSYETYLSNGVDELIVVPQIENGREISSGDKTMVHILDSLVNCNEKLFVMMEFKGNHSFFTNYEQEFEVYTPNSNNCAADQVRDSMMLINAYDNSILYTDYILSSIIQTIDRPNTISGFMFVSDHGEAIGQGGAGHGGNCKPKKCEYHVPFIFWWSADYAAQYPQKIENAHKNKSAKINGDCMYYTLIDMADISLFEEYYEPWSVLSDNFTEHQRLILVPDGKTCILAP